MKSKEFQKTVWDFYKKHKRDFPWRPPSLKLRKDKANPYKILISEVMLQQTQTHRVIPKYEAWIRRFPDFPSLATAPLSEVLKYWSGLGYNRRALYLKSIAEKIHQENNKQNIYHYIAIDILQSLPGIGPNTAGAIYVFVTNKPHVFIETNIRRVFIHHFGDVILANGVRPESDPGQARMTISDNELLPLIEQTLDRENPRQWYYALMDYGSYLAKHPPTGGTNPNRKSKHYVRQSKFEGSLRQVRGKILKILIDKKSVKISELKATIGGDSTLFTKALDQLKNEGFLKTMSHFVMIT